MKMQDRKKINSQSIIQDDKRFDASRWGSGSDGHLYDFAKRFPWQRRQQCYDDSQWHDNDNACDRDLFSIDDDADANKNIFLKTIAGSMLLAGEVDLMGISTILSREAFSPRDGPLAPMGISTTLLRGWQGKYKEKYKYKAKRQNGLWLGWTSLRFFQEFCLNMLMATMIVHVVWRCASRSNLDDFAQRFLSLIFLHIW